MIFSQMMMMFFTLPLDVVMYVFEDALRTFHTDGEWEQKPLKVTFFDEPAVDYGGPRREFFTILLKSIASNGSILDGNGNRRTLRHNTTAFQVRT